MGAVNDVAHDHIGNGIDDFGNDGEYHQKCTAPKTGELQDIRIIDIQIGRQHRIQQQCAGRAKKISQPFFPGPHLLGCDPASECSVFQ